MTTTVPADPSVVNKFMTEAEATAAAKKWSKDRREMWSVIHAPNPDTTQAPTAFYVERGDGGMVNNSERLVGSWDRGLPVAE
jgi:hypothetical protein